MKRLGFGDVWWCDTCDVGWRSDCDECWFCGEEGRSLTKSKPRPKAGEADSEAAAWTAWWQWRGGVA